MNFIFISSNKAKVSVIAVTLHAYKQSPCTLFFYKKVVYKKGRAKFLKMFEYQLRKLKKLSKILSKFKLNCLILNGTSTSYMNVIDDVKSC